MNVMIPESYEIGSSLFRLAHRAGQSCLACLELCARVCGRAARGGSRGDDGQHNEHATDVCPSGITGK